MRKGEDPWLDELLDSLPGWTWTPNREHAFTEQLECFVQAVVTGRPIRDQKLRAWMHTQRQNARLGKLSPERFERLREAGVFDLHMHRRPPKKCVQTVIEE